MADLEHVADHLPRETADWLRPLLRLIDRGVSTPDGTLFLAAHEAAHGIDLNLPDCATKTIDAALKALRAPQRLRAEAVAVAVSLRVCWALGAMGAWTRPLIVRRVVEDSRATAARWRRRDPKWTVAAVDRAISEVIYTPHVDAIAARVRSGDVPRG